MLHVDDALDIFAVHGIGGLVGNVCTAFFAADYIAHLDGVTVIDGGWINQHWVQLGYQLADSVSGGAYSFVMTSLILFLLNLIPGLHLRASEEAEILGIDDAEIGEFGKLIFIFYFGNPLVIVLKSVHVTDSWGQTLLFHSLRLRRGYERSAQRRRR